MDAIRLLKDDHQKVKKLFREYEAAGEGKKHGIVEQVFHELEVHTTLEEEIFYPAVKAKADEKGQELVAESLQEHHVVDVLMKEMKRLDPEKPEYEAKFTVLMENVEHHAEEEEKEMFPDAEKKLRGELERLGGEMERRKQELTARAR